MTKIVDYTMSGVDFDFLLDTIIGLCIVLIIIGIMTIIFLATLCVKIEMLHKDIKELKGYNGEDQGD